MGAGLCCARAVYANDERYLSLGWPNDSAERQGDVGAPQFCRSGTRTADLDVPTLVKRALCETEESQFSSNRDGVSHSLTLHTRRVWIAINFETVRAHFPRNMRLRRPFSVTNGEARLQFCTNGETDVLLLMFSQLV